MIKRFALVSSALALGMATVTPASAATILNFSQQGLGATVFASQSGSTTTLSATNVGIDISSWFGGAPQNAVFTLSATNVGAAVQFGTSVLQNYVGSFSIFTNTGPGALEILSGTFNTGLVVGNEQAGSLTSSSPSDAVAFTSSYASAPLASPALALSLVGVTPNVSLCNVGSGPATICSFSSSLTGNFSASAVPEPASWAMMVGGFGLLGATMRRRKPSVAVRIG